MHLYDNDDLEEAMNAIKEDMFKDLLDNLLKDKQYADGSPDMVELS